MRRLKKQREDTQRVNTQRPMARGLAVPLLAFHLAFHLVGCDSAQDSGSSDAGSGGTTTASDPGGEDTTGEPDATPQEGFRVFPKYMLHDVQAVVTLVGEDEDNTVSCPADVLEEGGYLCDTEPLSPLSEATIRVERDGFEPAEREASITPEMLEVVEVHLSVEGGPTGLWSDCTSLDTFATCADVCAAAEMVCAPASCAAEDDSGALATSRIFGDLDCTVEGASSASQACNAELPQPTEEAQAVRCCCES